MRALLDEHQDELALEVVHQVQLQADAAHLAQCAWDASDAVRLGGAADAALRLRALPADAGAEKSADRELVDPGPDACQGRRFEPLETGQPDVAAGPCTQAAARFAGRSCAVQGAAAQPEVPADEAYFEPWASQIARELAQTAPVAPLLAVRRSRVVEAALLLVAAVPRQPQAAPGVRVALPGALVSQRQV